MEPIPTDCRISLRDMGKMLGVSHSAVSLALRNSDQVSAKLRADVKRLAAEIGYQPDPMLSALSRYRRGKSSRPVQAAIAWINAWKEPEKLRDIKEFDAYWAGASRAARKIGYRLEEFPLNKECSPQRLDRILSTRGIHGILLPPHDIDPEWKDFPWENYCVVRFGRSLHTPPTHLVTSDQTENTVLAFGKILERGYRRIGFVTNEVHMRTGGHLFEAGYLIARRMVPENLRLPVCSLVGMNSAASGEQLAAW